MTEAYREPASARRAGSAPSNIVVTMLSRNIAQGAGLLEIPIGQAD
jgi:hypothetical protein